MNPYRVQDDVFAIPQEEPVPGYGVLPVLSYLLLGREPVLFDTGMARTREEFLRKLEQVVDPADIRWVVLSHPDADHAGALAQVLERAPCARLVLNMVSTGKLSGSMAPPMPRVTWMNAGESLALADRVLHFLPAPMYDCPSTVTVFDSKSGALLASDAYGAFVPQAAERFADLPEAAALDGMSTFCRVNSPWLADVRPDRYARALRAHAALSPSWVLPAHLPAATGQEFRRVLARAAGLPLEGRVPLPGQAALDAALASAARAA